MNAMSGTVAADNIVKLENINAPRFRNEWSPTTVVALLTLIGMIIGIGAMWQRLEGRIDLADRGISQLNTNVQVLDARTTGVPNIEYRVTKTEEAIAAGRQRGDDRQKQIDALRQDMNDLNMKIELILQSQKRIEEALETKR